MSLGLEFLQSYHELCVIVFLINVLAAQSCSCNIVLISESSTVVCELLHTFNIASKFCSAFALPTTLSLICLLCFLVFMTIKFSLMFFIQNLVLMRNSCSYTKIKLGLLLPICCTVGYKFLFRGAQVNPTFFYFDL